MTMATRGFWAALLVAGMMATGAATAPIVGNGGFETPPFPPSPGYGDIPVWTDNATTPEGVNPASNGDAPFLNGLTPPESTHAGFIQTTGTISQMIAGFNPGRTYQVIFWQDERGRLGTSAAERSVDLGGTNVASPLEVTRSSGGIEQFRRVVSRPFTATANSHLLEIHNLGGQDDNSLLVDDVSIRDLTPLKLLFQDNFDVDNTAYGNQPHVHADEYNVNYNLAFRQSGLHSTRTYAETAHSASGGGLNNYTQVDNDQPGGVLQDGLLIAANTTARFTAVSPNENFKQNVFNHMQIEFDVNPYIQGPDDGNHWAAIRFGDANQNAWPNNGANGFGILCRDDGRFQAFDDAASIASGGPGAIWPANETGWHTILIDVALSGFNGTPATITAYADGVQFLNYVKAGGFFDNYITLSGYYGGSAGGDMVHGFDNLNIYGQTPEPGTVALLGIGLAALARRRRQMRRSS
jgi:hypothetical protein